MRNTLFIVVGLVLVGGAYVYSQSNDPPPRGERGPRGEGFSQRDGEEGRPRERGPREGGRRERGEGDRGPGEGRRGGEGEGRRGGDGEGRRGGFEPPPNAFMEIFDTDKDGRISKEEIAGASEALTKLDKDNDGSLTPDEVPDPFRDMMERFRERRGGGGFGGDRGNFGPRRPGEEGGFGPGPGGPRGREGGPRRGRGGDDGFPPPPERSEEGENGAPDDGAAVEDAEEGTVLFRGGYDTKRVDRGRPVKLIAAALGVEEEVFREAFSGVRPSQDGPPSEGEARRNKDVLMEALAKHGVTNDRLDEVSNFYRYRPGRDQLWKHEAAAAELVLQDGKPVEIKVTRPGFGYMTPPEIVVAGYPDLKVEAELEFSEDLQQNGSIKTLKIVE